MSLGGCTMKIFSSLIKYHYSLYVKTNKSVMPVLTWLVFLDFLYSQKPLDIVSSILISSSVLYFIMLWVTISYMESIDPVSEQIVLLKVNNRNTYYYSKNTFVFLLGSALGFIGIVFPVLKNVVSGFTMFTRPITVLDIIFALILHIIVALLGASLGIIFQPRCIKNRKEALMLAILIAIISITKTGINHTFPITKYFTWIFPPMSDIVVYFNKIDYFSLAAMGKSVLFGCVYIAILLFISNQLLKRKLF